jgi:hypothetical protein
VRDREEQNAPTSILIHEANVEIHPAVPLIFNTKTVFVDFPFIML